MVPTGLDARRAGSEPSWPENPPGPLCAPAAARAPGAPGGPGWESPRRAQGQYSGGLGYAKLCGSEAVCVPWIHVLTDGEPSP